jgi:hypothetical protein
MDVVGPGQSTVQVEAEISDMTFCVGGMGRLLKVMVGQYLGLKVKVQWADFDPFILIPQSLYQVWSRFKWN